MSNKKAKGKRAKTRAKLKGGKKRTVNELVKNFDKGETVQICIDSSVHAGMPSPKYHGFTGTVAGKRGKAFEVAVRDGSVSRQLVVHAAHLKSLKVVKQ